MESQEVLRRTGARVEAIGLTRRFGEHHALDGVSLCIEPGETFGLLGANGAGKTTFIRLVTGYLSPTSGSVRVDGFSSDDQQDAINARLGYVPETSRLYPELRVESFLRFAGGLRRLSGRALTDAVERTLESFNLTEVARRMVGNLSKGFQQRVSLAQAFLHDPSLLIVDEPTAGLDPLQQAEVREVLGNMAGRRTVVLCTHDLAEARSLATRVAVLSHGQLVTVGTPEAVLGGDDPHALFRRAPGVGRSGKRT